MQKGVKQGLGVLSLFVNIMCGVAKTLRRNTHNTRIDLESVV
jgi:hypothetical protein